MKCLSAAEGGAAWHGDCAIFSRWWSAPAAPAVGVRQGGSVRAGYAWLCACGASGWGVGVLVVSNFNIFRCAGPTVHGQGAMAACAVRAS